MEKQSLIKYYCASFLVLVLLAGSNIAMAQTSSPTKPTTIKFPGTIQSKEKLKSESDNSMWIPLTVSILALIASGGAIALTILKNKEIDLSIESLKKKHTDELKFLDNKYTGLLNAQGSPQPSQQKELISYNSSASSTNAYLEASIERLSERINELEENKLQLAKNKEPSINYSKNTYQSFNLTSNVNPFEQIDIVQPLENLAHVELVNTYNTNPKLLEQTAIKVSEDKDSIARRHTDSSQKIVLRQTNNGNYWVVHDDVSVNCWLLPKVNLRVNQYNYETTKALFECHGYQLEHYNKFKLIKPANVILLSSDEQTWQINELGILEFTVED